MYVVSCDSIVVILIAAGFLRPAPVDIGCIVAFSSCVLGANVVCRFVHTCVSQVLLSDGIRI